MLVSSATAATVLCILIWFHDVWLAQVVNVLVAVGLRCCGRRVRALRSFRVRRVRVTFNLVAALRILYRALCRKNKAGDPALPHSSGWAGAVLSAASLVGVRVRGVHCVVDSSLSEAPTTAVVGRVEEVCVSLVRKDQTHGRDSASVDRSPVFPHRWGMTCTVSQVRAASPAGHLEMAGGLEASLEIVAEHACEKE